MDYQFKQIEKNWQKFWAENATFKAEVDESKPKYYVLDMFPYPSGAGLHVGHPLGYIASDIFSRYKRLKGFNVLHPMGYDSFGLPAEQYAIQTGQHPAKTTETNINRYREQLDNLGFSFDWSKEVRTSSPDYYKWTQWIFMQLFNSWYNKETDKAEPISTLIAKLETIPSAEIEAVCDEDVLNLLPSDWSVMNAEEKQAELLKYRLTYLRESTVNWCPALGTVLANDEVKDGYSERGGHPVEQKKMMQWSMRITAYAERLLQGLNNIDWPEPLKEMQRNWIGKSIGAMVRFSLESPRSEVGGRQSANSGLLSSDYIEVFTTRVDTIYGVSFLVIAPEHELVKALTTDEQKAEIEAYILQTKKKSELDRMADTKTVSGAFTGSYAINPVNRKKVPVWIADYVLAGYGTGAVMAVPSGDQRDYLFAKHFNLPIIQIMDIQKIDVEADSTKEGKYINSGIIDGLGYKEATPKIIDYLKELGMGYGKINYRMRDAIFGRQRYWGEPVPIYFKNGLPYLIDESELPLLLPEVDKYLPTESGEPPLGRAKDWKYRASPKSSPKERTSESLNSLSFGEGGGEAFGYELSTMPGWAGSSWYWYRYMDAKNNLAFADKKAIAYWKDVDLYIGGSEHATGHLLYSRFWNKFLKDLSYVTEEEPFKKLINQGMIQGRSSFVYRVVGTNILISKGILSELNQSKEDGKLTENLVLALKGINKIWNNFFDEKTGNVIPLLPQNLKEEELSKMDYYSSIFTISSFNVDVNIVENDILNIEKFRASREEYKDAVFIFEDGTNSLSFGEGRGEAKYICGHEVEKMSKSKFNVVSPDDLIERYGADTLRMYEMFLGPLEQSKPWNTNGIEGVFKFLRKFWRLFHHESWNFTVSNDAPTKAELKSLHKIIKKVEDDVERFSFNTSVSSFMIAVNELTDLKCNKKAILQDLVIILSPYAPHICEELWVKLGNPAGTLSYAPFPIFNPSHLVENEFNYPVSINGKTKTNVNLSLAMEVSEMEKFVLESELIAKYLDGKSPKKVIIVKGRIINIVV